MFAALILLLVANGTPALAGKILRDRANWPLDAHINSSDGKPLLGKSKTLRGILLALIATALIAELLGLGWLSGMFFAALAMAGDLFSSFTKRRLGLASGSKVPGLDQIPEALLPLLVFSTSWALQWYEILLLVGIFWVLDVVLSRVLSSLPLYKQ